MKRPRKTHIEGADLTLLGQTVARTAKSDYTRSKVREVSVVVSKTVLGAHVISIVHVCASDIDFRYALKMDDSIVFPFFLTRTVYI